MFAALRCNGHLCKALDLECRASLPLLFLFFLLEAYTLHTFVFQTDRGIKLMRSMDLTLSLCFPALDGVEDGLQRRRTERRAAQEQGAWPGTPSGAVQQLVL